MKLSVILFAGMVATLIFPRAIRAQENSVLRSINLKPETIQALTRIGIPMGAESAKYDVFVLADASEEGRSGKVLVDQLQALMAKYPKDIRLWYVHFLLVYREARADVLVSSGCLGEQNAFWSNIRAYVANEAKPYPPLGLYPGITDPEKYADCVANENNPTHKRRITTDKELGQQLLSQVDAVGIPAMVFVDVKKPSQAILLQGAYPTEEFIRAFEELKTRDGGKDLPPSENKKPEPVTPSGNIFERLAAALRAFWQTLTAK
ncbi:MAG: hypothetical protein ACOY3M_06040 [Patescibacteria group bacterium]